MSLQIVHKLKENPGFFVIFLTFVAFAIRLLYIYFHPITDLIGDEHSYVLLANTIASGQGFSLDGVPSSFHPPFYPFVLAFFFKLFGENYLIVKLFQALMGSLLCIPFYLFVKRLFSEKIARYATAYYVIYLSTIAVMNNIQSEGIFTILFLISIFIFTQSKSKSSSLVSGVLFGFAALTRPLVMYFPFLLIPVIIYRKKYFQFMFILGFCLALTPWTIRNYKVHGVFMPIASYGGYILYGSNHPTDGKIFGFMIPSDPVIEEYETIKSEVERNRFMMKHGIQTILDEPMRVIKLSGIKFLTFIVPFDWEIISRTGEARYNLTYVILFPFFILGLLILLLRTKSTKFEHFILISLFAYFLFFSVFLYGSPRFRLPLEPLMIIYGAFAYCKLKEKMIRPYLLNIALLLFAGLNVHIFYHSDMYKTALAGLLHTVGIW